MNKLYLLSQNTNNDYDTYDSCIVSAATEEEARYIEPSGYYKWHDGAYWFQYMDGTERKTTSDLTGSWAPPSEIDVKEIGKTNLPIGLILASYNAG